MKKVAVLMGGPSAEREVSLNTGRGIAVALRQKGHSVVEIDFEPQNFSKQLTESEAEVVFIALHGRYGEDGAVQGFLDICGIPYTGSGARTSNIAMDKYLSKKLFEAFQIPTPKSVLLHKEDPLQLQQEKVASLGYPLIVKPIAQGSSIGVFKIENVTQVENFLHEAFHYGNTILAEEFIQGRELTVAVLEEIGSLPIIEIRPYSGAYDYQSKYTKGATEYIVPANLSEEKAAEIMGISSKVAKAFEGRGVIRIDIMLSDKEQIPYVLELNTIPGMTETSLVPKASAAMGINYEDLCERILLKACYDE
jgi:D-alanine--D-alanine ligase